MSELPVIFIVGCKPVQGEAVAQALQGLATVKHAKPNQHGRMGALGPARQAHAVILMTGFVSHSHLNFLRAVRNDIIYCKGGVTSITTAAKDWLNKEKNNVQ